MTIMPGFDTLPAPASSPGEFLSHDREARKALEPVFDTLLHRLEKAGWDARVAASALMFHAAARISGMNAARTRQ